MISTLRIDIPTRYFLPAGSLVYHTGDHLEEIGLEDFSIGNLEPKTGAGEPVLTVFPVTAHTDPSTAAYGLHGSIAITLRRVRNGWVHRVGSFRPAENAFDMHLLSHGVRLQACRSLTLRDCDFQKARYTGRSGNGYIYHVSGQEILFEDCRAGFSRHGFVFNGIYCSGNVILRGLTRDSGRFGVGGKGTDHHQWLSQSNLLDGINVKRDFVEARYRAEGTVLHGVTSAHSVFWNVRGLEYFPDRHHAVHSEQGDFGYVIGTRGSSPGVLTQPTNEDSPFDQANHLRTLPEDHIEGIGEGETLEPRSLYVDQLSRRTGLRPPTVRMDSPGSRLLIEPGSTLYLKATASDPDGTVEKVTFYASGVPIKTVSESPFRFEWEAVPTGHHLIEAVATDDHGMTGSSQGITIYAVEALPRPLLFLPFEDSGRLGRDFSGNGSHGLEEGIEASGGRFGEGLKVNGGGRIDLDEDLMTSEEGSVLLWFRMDRSVEKHILYYGSRIADEDGFSDGKRELHLHISNGQVGFEINGAEERSVSISSIDGFDNGQWHHAAATWNRNGEAILYVDGLEVDRAPHQSSSFDFRAGHRLGRPGVDLRGYNGELDEVLLFSEAFSKEAVGAIMRCGVPTFALWAAGELGDAAVTGEADPDGDGIPHLLEYALGLDPRLNDGKRLPEMLIDDETGKAVIWRNAFFSDLEQEVELSTDLTTWRSASGLVRETDTGFVVNGLRRVRLEVTDPELAQRERTFFRLRVRER
ncbi:MAG: LamG-like jellyroll fold domain-containing protein [Verrucomicrobiota bacterium]